MQFVESVGYGQEESRLNSDRLGFGLASVVSAGKFGASVSCRPTCHDIMPFRFQSSACHLDKQVAKEL